MPALSPSLLPTLLLLPRQDRTSPTATSSAPEIANSSAERFLPSASSTGDAGTHSDQGNGDTRAGLWKYAIVIILAVSALFLTVRLLFIYRLRKARLLAFQEQQNLLHQRRQDRADAERARRAWTGMDSRRDSFDSLEEAPWERGRGQSGFDGLAGARSRGHEPPPPGYEETVAPPTAPSPPQQRPSLFKRLFSSTSSIFPHTASSFSPSTPSSSNPPTSINLQPLSSSSRSADNNPSSSSSFPSSNITRSRASVEAEAVRRALADAGLLVVPPSLALRGSRRLSSTGGPTSPPPSGSSPSAALSADDFEAAARRERRERRERRRERRRRRREQEEEGFGLPTYSKERGEGEEVLQRGEGVKSDEEDGEGSSGEESGSEDERGGGGRRRASTSAALSPVAGGGGGGEGGESAGSARGPSSPLPTPPQA